MREVRIFEKNTDMYVVRKKIPGTRRKKVITFSGIPRPRGIDQSNWAIMDDKGAFKKICQKHGLPVGRGGYASSFAEAVKIFDRIDKPVIVKPRLGSRGRHVVTYVRNHDDLRAAYTIAKQLCLWVVVEEQFIAPVYRATVIDFELAGVLSGTQPLVIGDDKTPLTGLISYKNTHRDAEVEEVRMDQNMAWFLKRQLSCDGRIQLSNEDLTKPWKQVSHTNWDKKIFEYVPKKDEVVYLSEKIGLSYGGDSAEEFDICHPENKTLFAKAAKIFGDPIVGFDFMIPNITKSWKEQRCGFLEANTVPFINLHHHPHRGTPRNVAAKVWDLMKL